MGNFQSTDNEALKKSNVKLQAQSVSPFDGSSIKWHPWKKKTRAAIGTAGLLKILDDDDYATRNPVDNETVFHLLQVATSDGNAAHLVDKFEEECDGRKAYAELVKWYEGDDLTSETAEDIRSKIDKLYLSSNVPASNYINDFLQYVKLLDGLGEAYTTSKTVSIFLSQITDPDYAATKENCIEDKLPLEQCIERIRSKERRVGRTKAIARRGIQIRRDNIQTTRHHESTHGTPQGDIDISQYKNQLGFYSIPKDLWKKLTIDDQTMIKKLNGVIRRKRERETSIEDKHKMSTTLVQRRNPVDEPDTKRIKTVQFRDDSETNDHEDSDKHIINEEETNAVTTRRDILRFRVRD